MPTSTPQSAQQSRTATLMRDIRKTPIFRQLVPMEAGVGWPLPMRRHDRVYLTLPFYGMPPRRGKGGTPLYPPFAAITQDWRNGRVVSYRDLHFEALWAPPSAPIGSFPHEAVAKLRRSEYLERRDELLGMYDELFETLATGASFSEEWMTRFSGLLQTMMEPSLKPFYRVLQPKFIDTFLAEQPDADGSPSTAA